MWLEVFPWRSWRRRAPLLLALLSSGLPAQERIPIPAPQWRPIGPNAAPNVRVILFDGPSRTLYAGTEDRGIWSTSDEGRSWHPFSQGLTNLSVTALARFRATVPLGCFSACVPQPTIVYAGTDGGGVFQRAEFEGTWTPDTNGLTNLKITSIAVHPVTGTAYAATDGGGVFKKSSGEIPIWRPVNNGLSSLRIRLVVVSEASENLLLASGYTVKGDPELFRSSDGGASWSAARLEFPDAPALSAFTPTSFALDPTFSSSVYVTGHASCLCGAPPVPAVARSDDAGASWTVRTENGFAGSSLIVDLPLSSPGDLRPRRLLLASSLAGGVFTSFDTGSSWSRFGDLALPVKDLAVVPTDNGSNRVFYAATPQGIFVNGDCGPSTAALHLGLCRFRVEVDRELGPSLPALTRAGATWISDDTGGFWFFEPKQLDVVVKIVDGRAINGRIWVFLGGLSHFQYFVTVTDTETRAIRTYMHARGEPSSFTDTSAFWATGGPLVEQDPTHPPS